MVLKQHRRRGTNGFHYHFANFIPADQRKTTAWDSPPKLIGLGSQVNRDRSVNSRKCCGVRRVRVDNPTHIRPMAINIQMGGSVRRRFQIAIYYLPVQIHN